MRITLIKSSKSILNENGIVKFRVFFHKKPPLENVLYSFPQEKEMRVKLTNFHK